MRNSLLFSGMIVVFLLMGCIGRGNRPSTDDPPTATMVPIPTSTPTPDATIAPEAAVRENSATIVQALSGRDMITVAEMAHPIKGVRFTPYVFVQDSDATFMPDDIEQLMNDPTVYRWGVYQGEGGFIDDDFATYFESFVYDEAYQDAEQQSINEPLSQGSMIDNSQTYYADPMVVEYYFSGFDPQFGGLDWTSLRLVFEQYEGEWVLVGIIHAEWTT